jgi:hypothetical protein
MWVTEKTGTDSGTDTGRRRTIRWVAAGVSGILVVLYAGLLFIVYRQEAQPGGQGTTYGAYIFLGLAYLIGALALALSDRQAVLVVGIAVQVAVVVLYLVFGTEADVSMWWGVATVALEVALFGLLAYLLGTAPRRRVSGLTDFRSGWT